MSPIVTTSSRRRPGRSPALPIIIAALVLLAAAAVYLGMRDSSPQRPQPPQHPVVSDTTPPPPKAAPTSVSDAVPTTPAEPARPPSSSSVSIPAGAAAQSAKPPTHPPAPGGALSDRPDAIRDLPGHVTLPDGNVMTFPTPEPGKTISLSAQGRVYLADSVGNFVDATPPPVFDNAIEEQMVGISTPGGHFIPGLFLANSPAAITNMLYKDVVINEDDSDDIKAKKEAVAETKQLMVSYLEAGYSISDVVMAISELAEQERTLRRKGVSTIMRLVREGDIEGARKYKETLDEVAAGQQLTPIVLPKRVSEALYGDQPPVAN